MTHIGTGSTPDAEKEKKKKVWKTIDYIGGGYVLQEKKLYVGSDNDVWGQNPTELHDYVEDNNDHHSHYADPCVSHRVVHVTELHDVDVGEFMGDAKERLNIEDDE